MSLSTQIAFLSFVAFSRLKVILAVTDVSLAIQSPDSPSAQDSSLDVEAPENTKSEV